MKTNLLNFIILISIILGCLSCNQEQTEIPTIDATKNYPEKEILLSDLGEVSYVSPKADEDYFYYDGVRYIAENTMVMGSIRYGDFVFFSRDGSPKSKFNKTGRGPEEYTFAMVAIYDEKADELFVVQSNNIKVYSSSGVYKREFPIPEGTVISSYIVSFDDESLFFNDISMSMKRQSSDEKDLSSEDFIEPYYRISKIDGKVLDYFEMPIKPVFLAISGNSLTRRAPARQRKLIKSTDGVFLCNPENDTVFLYSNKDYSFTPLLVKTPQASSMNPIVFMNNCFDTERYVFTELCVCKEGGVDSYPFPRSYYMIDKKTKEVFVQKLRLAEYEEKEFIISPLTTITYGNGCAFWISLTELKEAYAENKLSGKLKELVASLDDEDNDVFVFLDFKK